VVAGLRPEGHAARGTRSGSRQGRRCHREALPPFDLTRPASRCGACGHKIRWYQNIPVLSYLLLRGRCASCKTSISPRYPLVELVTGALFALCGWRFGLTPTGALWAAFAALLICQFLIDFDTQFLPDSLNYPCSGSASSAQPWAGPASP
jgi:leader peptidase (prepilin peptidase)/N-methyltransferase